MHKTLSNLTIILIDYIQALSSQLVDNNNKSNTRHTQNDDTRATPSSDRPFANGGG